MADIKERIIIESVDNTTRGMRSAQNKLNALDRTLKRVQTTMLGFVGINIGIHVVQNLAKISDTAIELDAKLKLMTDSTEEFNKAQSKIKAISLESGSSLEANTILFTRMNKAIKNLGGTTEDTLGLTRTLSQGLRISGASAQESASVIRQVSQAFSSGVLRGEEFNAVMENGGRLAIALADGIGVDVGALRAMAKEGELTADRVMKAWKSQADVIAEENARLPLTIGRAIENVKTEWLGFLKTLSSSNSDISRKIDWIAQNFRQIITVITELGEALTIVFGVKALQAFVRVGGGIDAITRSINLSTYAIFKQAAANKQLALDQKMAHAQDKGINAAKLIQKRKELEAELKLAATKAEVAAKERINTAQSLLDSRKKIALSLETAAINAKNNLAQINDHIRLNGLERQRIKLILDQ